MVEKEIKDALQYFEGKMEENSDMIKSLLSAIKGNPITGDGGIVQEIKETNTRISHLEERLKPLEQFKDRFMWTIILIGGVGAALGTIMTILINLLKK